MRHPRSEDIKNVIPTRSLNSFQNHPKATVDHHQPPSPHGSFHLSLLTPKDTTKHRVTSRDVAARDRPPTGRPPAAHRPPTGRPPAAHRPPTGRPPAAHRPSTGQKSEKIFKNSIAKCVRASGTPWSKIQKNPNKNPKHPTGNYGAKLIPGSKLAFSTSGELRCKMI